MKVKEESEKVGLKLSIQKTKIMASGPITSWQINQKTVETVADFIYLFIYLTPKSLQMVKLKDAFEIKRCFILGRKTMANLDSVLKSREHHFANKGPYNQSYGFSSSHIWM